VTTERIDIIVSERGSRAVKRNLEDIGGSARGAAGGVQFLQRALVSLGVSIGVAQLIRMADTYTLITNRLRLVTTGTANLARVNDELFDSAQRTRSSYEATATLYATVARNAETLGLGQKDLLDITETVNQSIAVSGTSAQSASAGLIQLSQALGSGVLRGDELNSIMENMPRLAQAIADGMGITVGQLRALGAEGELTSQAVVAAIQKSAPGIAAEFSKITPTVGSSLQALSDSFLKFIGELDQSLGITAGLAQAILFLADNMEVLVQAAAVLALGLAAAFSPSILGAIGAVTSQVFALTAAIAANPIGLLLVAVTAIISYLYIFRGEISVTADGVVSLGDVFRSIFSFIGELVRSVVDFFKQAWTDGLAAVSEKVGGFLGVMVDVLAAILDFVKTVVNAYVGLWVGAYNAIIAGWGLFPGALRDLGVMAMNGLIDVVSAGIQGVLNAVQSLLTFIGGAAELVGSENPFANMIAPDVVTKSLAGFKGTVTGAAGELGSVVSSAFAESFATDYVGNLVGAVMDRAREIALSKDTGSAGTLNPADTPALPGNPLSDTGTGGGGAGGGGAGGGAAEGASNLSDQLKRMKDILEEIRGPLDDYIADTAALQTLLDAGGITVDEYNKKWRELRATFLETQDDMASGLELGLLKIQEDMGTWASNTSDFAKNTFNNIGGAINDFVMTGKFNFSDFTQSMISGLVQIVTQMLILKPIAESLMGVLGGIGGGGGGGGFLSGLLGGGGGGGFLSGLLGGIFKGGFATGGSFAVGGSGGVDSQMVAFRASPGERVNITRPGEEDRNGGTQRVTMNVYTQDAESFKRSESQISAKLARMTQRGRRNL
jgi:tape measure domain-containing protein